MIGNAPPTLAFLSGGMPGKASPGTGPADGASGFGALVASLASTSALASAGEGRQGLQEISAAQAGVTPADMVLDMAVPVDASGNPIMDELASEAAPVDQMPTASADGVALAAGVKLALPVLSPADRAADAGEVPAEEHEAVLPIAARIMAMFLRTSAAPKGEVRGPDGEQAEEPTVTDDSASLETDGETAEMADAVILTVASPTPPSPPLGGTLPAPATPVASTAEPDQEADGAPAQPVLPQGQPRLPPDTELASSAEPEAGEAPPADRDAAQPAAVFRIPTADSDGIVEPGFGTSEDRSSGPVLREAHARNGDARIAHPVDGGMVSDPEASAMPASTPAADASAAIGDAADTSMARISATAAPVSATVSDSQPISVTVQPAVPAPSPSAIADPAAVAHADVEQMAMERHLDLAHDSDWLDQLARDIVSTGAGNSKLQFKLNPENLGSLHVELIRRDDGATVRMTTDSEAARSMLADAQGRLVAEARVQGVRITETSVDLSRGGGGGDQNQRGLGDPQSGQHNSHSQHRDVNGSVTTNGVHADRTEAPATRHERYA